MVAALFIRTYSQEIFLSFKLFTLGSKFKTETGVDFLSKFDQPKSYNFCLHENTGFRTVDGGQCIQKEQGHLSNECVDFNLVLRRSISVKEYRTIGNTEKVVF